MLVAASAGAHEPAFEPHSATYGVSRNGSTIGRIDVDLSRRDDGLWHYRIESTATAWYLRLLGVSATESAWFQWYGDRVLPLTYHHVSREPGRNRYWQHRYDWQQGATETRTHDRELKIALAGGVLDPLTLRLAAVDRIAAQAPDLDDFEFRVLERDEIETQQYRFVRRERAEVLGRCYDTVVYRRFRKPGSSRNYTAWHARELGWMPVRIVHDEDQTITLALQSWSSATYALPNPGACETRDQPTGQATSE